MLLTVAPPVHKAQLLLLIDAQLVPVQPRARARRGPGAVSFGTRRCRKPTASDEHVPDAVNVEVVVSGLHESIQQDGTARDEAARSTGRRASGATWAGSSVGGGRCVLIWEAEKGRLRNDSGTQARAGRSGGP